MRIQIDRLPLHPLLFAIFPTLSLYVANIQEVEGSVIFRPILVSLLLAGVLFVLFHLVLRKAMKAAAVTTFLLLLFFSYGHVYHFVHGTFGASIGRHRFLFPVYLVILGAGLWFLLRKVRDFLPMTRLFNILSLFLVLFPTFQIGLHSLQSSEAEQVAETYAAQTTPLVVDENQPLPDVYYIILDTYTRGDALQRDFGFDNSDFLNSLRELGFYVADCSRSNYSYTQGSLTTALSMEYLPTLFQWLVKPGVEGNIWTFIKQSPVRLQLEAVGYKTVAFETDFEWSRLSDADIFFSYDQDPEYYQLLSPFEIQLLKTTAMLFFSDTQKKGNMDRYISPYEGHPFGNHIGLQLFILEKLPTVPAIPGPKFVFVHILIPHVPYVFGPQGEILTDPGFFGGENAMAVNEDYLRQGYTGEIQFINSRILEIFRTIIAESDVPPLIVMHSDHGVRDDNRLKILLALYLPGRGQSVELHPGISPVNSFRVIFDTYFGTHYGLLPDESFFEDAILSPVPETSPACITP